MNDKPKGYIVWSKVDDVIQYRVNAGQSSPDKSDAILWDYHTAGVIRESMMTIGVDLKIETVYHEKKKNEKS